MLNRTAKPFFERRRQLVVCPMLILARRRRIDDACDVPRPRKHEGDRTAEQLRAFVDGNRGGDVILFRGLEKGGRLDLPDIQPWPPEIIRPRQGRLAIALPQVEEVQIERHASYQFQ